MFALFARFYRKKGELPRNLTSDEVDNPYFLFIFCSCNGAPENIMVMVG